MDGIDVSEWSDLWQNIDHDQNLISHCKWKI